MRFFLPALRPAGIFTAFAINGREHLPGLPLCPQLDLCGAIHHGPTTAPTPAKLVTA
jgi:hypothetical protein